jgi:hypothetical protein
MKAGYLGMMAHIFAGSFFNNKKYVKEKPCNHGDCSNYNTDFKMNCRRLKSIASVCHEHSLIYKQ